MRRAFLLLLLLSFCLTTWAQESPLRDFDPDTIRTLYFDYASGSGSIMVYPDYDGAALQIVVDSLGGYEDRMTDFRTKRALFTVKHEAAGKHAVLLMYYPNGALRLSARLLEDSTAGPPTAFFVPSFRRPLSAYALLDGITNTFYPDGTTRQQALYRLGIRVSSQCYDFKKEASCL